MMRPSGRTAVAVLAVILLALVAAPARAGEGDNWFGRDKALHASAGAALGAGGYAGGAVVFEQPGNRVVSGLVLSLGLGAAKEWRDRGRGNPSWRDFAWGGVGAATGVTLAWLIDHARHARRARLPAPAKSAQPDRVRASSMR